MRTPWRRPTVRLRLTLLYGGLFLVAGIALLAMTYVLVERSTGRYVVLKNRTGPAEEQPPQTFRSTVPDDPSADLGLPDDVVAELRDLREESRRRHEEFLEQLVTQSAVALGSMVVVAMGLGWVVAGRALRPLRAMTTAAQRISEHNLHERLAVDGRRDEVKDLADTIDGLLGRLETAFEAQRRFVANASHELRTPITFERALVDVALANPHATIDDLRATCADVLQSTQQQELLIDALLTLASSERGLDRWDPLDLATVTDDLVSGLYGRPLQVDADLGPAPMKGNRDLVRRLVTNLLDNAVRHNVPDGRIDVATSVVGERAVLTVANTGPLVPPEELDRLFQPFQRLGADRAGHPDGHGLGLSIVQAVATAHGAELTVASQPNGGLRVEVRFPVQAPHGARAPGP